MMCKHHGWSNAKRVVNIFRFHFMGTGARCRQQAFRPVEKVFGFFLSLPLWRPKSSRFSRWLLSSIDESLLYQRKTLNAIFRRIAWSINSMFWGRFPTVDENGLHLNHPRSGRHLTRCHSSFAFTELRGDWSFYHLIFGLHSSWKAGANKSVCYLCEAYGKGQPQNQYWNIEENCPCWGTIHTKASFLAKEMPDEDVCILPLIFVESNRTFCCLFWFTWTNSYIL